MSSAARSAPSVATIFARQSFASMCPIRTCRALNTARQSCAVHASGDSPSIAYSTGNDSVVSMKPLTPSAYASNIALVSALMAS